MALVQKVYGLKVLVRVDPQHLVMQTQKHLKGYSAKEPSAAMIRQFVKDYEQGSAQERLDMVMMNLTTHPLRLLRSFERVKERACCQANSHRLLILTNGGGLF